MGIRSPQRHVVADARRANGSEEDGVVLAQPVEADETGHRSAHGTAADDRIDRSRETGLGQSGAVGRGSERS